MSSTPAPAVWRLFEVVEQFRTNWRENARDALLLAAFAGPLLLYLTGFLAGNTATAQAVVEIKSQLSGLVTVQDANRLKEQLNGLATQVSQLQSELRAAPRADQLIVLANQIAEQRGHTDAMDTRLRDAANLIAGLQAELNMINRASSARLGKQ